MRIVTLVSIFGLLCALALLAYIRLAPSDPAVWHVLPTDVKEETGAGFAMRRLDATPEVFAALDEVARSTPRTHVLAGSIEDGMITYVTRSAVIGFPDYTTVALVDGTLVMYARLRFGQSDLGVNAARLDSWISALNG